MTGNTQDKAKLVEAFARVEFDSPQGHFRFDPKTRNVIQPFILFEDLIEWLFGGGSARSRRRPSSPGR